MVTCPNCQTQNRDNARFCSRCGRVLQGAAPTPPGAQPPRVPIPPQTPYSPNAVRPQPAVPPAPGARASDMPGALPAASWAPPSPASAAPGMSGQRRPLEYLLLGCGMFVVGILCAAVLVFGASALSGGTFLGFTLPFAKTSTQTPTATEAVTTTVTPTEEPTGQVATVTSLAPTRAPAAPSVTPQPTAKPPANTPVPTTAPTAKPQTGLIGQHAPDFVLEALDGKEFSFSVRTRNSPTVLLFWKSMPLPEGSAEVDQLNSRFKSYQSQGLLAILVDVGERKGELDFYFKIRSHDFPVLLDLNQAVANQYGAADTPVYFFVGKDGIVREQVSGQISDPDLDARINAILQ